MFPTFISILDIQSWWEVPSIAHFCSLFRAAFNLLDFDIEDLEEALLTDGTEETSWLQELIVRLLSGCLANNEISTFNYQMFLRRLFRQKCQEYDRYNPFNTDIDFQFLPLRTKVEILQALCDFRLDAEDVLDHLKNLEADSLRVEPLGYDDNESAYWYFYGTRLYREDHTFKNNKKVKSVWQVICFTEEDWYQLTKKFRKSSSKAERQLYRTLSENFLPELPRLFQEKEVLHRKRLLEWLPRRTSTRLDIKRQQIKEPVVPEPPPDEEERTQEQKQDEEKDSVEEVEDTEEELSTRKKHKPHEKCKKRKDTVDRKRKLEEKRHAGEMAERRKQRELRSLNRGKAKLDTADIGSAVPVNANAANIPGATTVGRQTNNSLASATGQIVIQSVSNPNRKKLKTSQVFRQSDEDLQTGMYKILEAVKNHEDAWPFVEPVEEEYAPNYYTIIRRPMDLQRMEDKLDSGLYLTFSKFKQDFQLIVDNCRLYNGHDNEYTEMVDNLQQAFERATERYLDQISSSDEEIAVEFQESSRDSRSAGDVPKNKRKKNESVANVGPKRKPTAMAHTADKRDRSPSAESSHRSGSADTFDKLKNEKTQKLPRAKTQPAPTKPAKPAKNDVKGTKQNKRNKKVSKSPSPRRSRTRSRSPSWPLSSPEHWKSSERRDTSPSVTSRQKDYSSDENKSLKAKGKHKHWKEVFKDKKNTNKVEKEAPPKPKETLKQKDKNIKLKETIEKLKAKNELSLSDEGILRNKNREDKQKDKVKNVKNDKCDKNIKKINQNKSKPKVKEAPKSVKSVKSEFDFEDEGSTKDSNLSDGKKTNKKPVKKTAVKNVADIDALAAATEQTLKDINKWLDDTPRFPEFSSASNSPSHFISAEESDPIGTKIEQEYRKNLKMDKPMPRPKDGQKDLFKRRPAQKDVSKLHRRREIQRTIERLQPGKGKGNLLSNLQNANKPEELFPLGPLSKLRDSKNSLVVKQDDTAPKLSLGTVLDSFGQQHNFSEDTEIKDSDSLSIKDEIIATVISVKSESCAEDKSIEIAPKKDEAVEPKQEVMTEKKEIKGENKATPNLSAWFKAFGAPKVQPTQKKKLENEEEKKEQPEVAVQEPIKPIIQPEVKTQVEEPKKVVSPEPDSPAGPTGQPIPRQRRGSTGSSMSERSSFSQDMDSSPRMSIDERLGAYPAPYPSPLHRSPASASPVMASPRQEEPQRPYPTLNGSMRVGFYQDTVSTKSSPDKSCSPRDQPQSPYQQYSEHVYTPPNTMQSGGFSYTNPPYYSQQPPAYTASNPSPVYGERNNPPTYYDTNKSLTDQYNAKVPNANFQSEESVNSPESEYKNPSAPLSNTESQFRQQIRVPEKQTTMFPVKKRLYNDNEMANNRLDISREEQEISVSDHQDSSRDSFGNNRSLEMGLMTGRQINIGTPIQQHPSPTIQEIRPASREQQQYTPPHSEAMKDPEVAYPRPLNKPYETAHGQMQPNREMDINMQLPTNQSLSAAVTAPIRPMNFAATSTNLYMQNDDDDDAYTLNMSVNNRNLEMNTRQESEERQLEMSKLANMGYLNPNSNADIVRTSQYQALNYNRPASRTDEMNNTQNVPQSVPSSEHMNLSMRYSDSRVMPMGYRGPGLEAPRGETQPNLSMSPMQNSDLLQMPQNARTPTNLPNRMGQSVDIPGSNYKGPDMTIPRPTFNSPPALGIDQSLGLRGNLANLSHIVDRYPNEERLLSSLQTSTPYYTDKGLSSPHMFAKAGIPTSLHASSAATSSLPMFSQPNVMSYGRDMQQPQVSIAYTRTMTELQAPSPMLAQAGKNTMQQQQQQQSQQQTQHQHQHQHVQQSQQPQPQVQQQSQPTEKKPGRKRKVKQAVVATSVPSEVMCSTASQQQGFQSYAGLKNTVSGEPSAISLKTASVVPGSAFNFGPTPTGLGLPSGLYGDKDGYAGFLDEFRPATNYYMAAAAAAAHRATPEGTTDKPARPAHQQSAAAAAPSFPFLGHPQPRAPGYPSLAAPFIGAHQPPLMDPGSPLYQQYLHSGVLHQGLLAPPAGYPPGYHPALSMRQPYDPMTRPSWL